MLPTNDDVRFMGYALELAHQGTGSTYPNPCVGAVVVKNGEILGAAHSSTAGGPHAEVLALRIAGEQARGSTLYVTLEPCSHTGRTPPCTDALIQAGIKEVVFGIQDPAKHARGRGVLLLRQHGILVREGILADECTRIHEHYLYHEHNQKPFVSLKAACSLDGQIACASGDSRWITSQEARMYGHQLRAQHHAIAVGVSTVLHDDPQLNVRLSEGADPIPIIFDSRLRLLDGASVKKPQILREGTLVLHTAMASEARRRALQATGAEGIEVAATPQGQVSLTDSLDVLGSRQIRSLLVEGGGQLLATFVQLGAWNRWFLFHAPVLLGKGLPLLPGLAWSSMAQAPRLTVKERIPLADDMLTILERNPCEEVDGFEASVEWVLTNEV